MEVSIDVFNQPFGLEKTDIVKFFDLKIRNWLWSRKLHLLQWDLVNYCILMWDLQLNGVNFWSIYKLKGHSNPKWLYFVTILTGTPLVDCFLAQSLVLNLEIDPWLLARYWSKHFFSLPYSYFHIMMAHTYRHYQ